MSRPWLVDRVTIGTVHDKGENIPPMTQNTVIRYCHGSTRRGVSGGSAHVSDTQFRFESSADERKLKTSHRI
jgi:hypothetical protein